MASLHAESGEVELAMKELDETIALKRSIGQDDWTAQSLVQAADSRIREGTRRARAIFWNKRAKFLRQRRS